MTVREYIGARYVPLFMGEWDSTVAYEPLSIVQYQGNSYTSRQAVPAGIPITNETFWAVTGNYNAQIEAYRAEVRTFDGRITVNAEGVASNTQAIEDEAAARAQAIEGEAAARAQAVTDEATARAQADTAINSRITGIENELANQAELIYIGDSWGVTETGIFPSTLAKMLNCKLHNYAVSSMGFVQGTNNFGAQATRALADTTVNADKVRYILIFGGSNDFSHGITDDTVLTTAIDDICSRLAAKFKNAEIHVGFNVRFAYGSIVYYHLNPQLKLWNDVAQRMAYSGVRAIAHPESMCWFSKTHFTDNVHLSESAFKYCAQYMAQALTGGKMVPDRTNVTTVALDGYEGTSGNAYHYFDERSIWVEVYLHVLSDQNGTHGIKTQNEGMFPVELFVNPEANKVTNHITIPMVRADSKGSCNISVNFSTNETGRDTIYMLPIAEGDSIPAGYYFGFSKFRTFPNA